MKYRDPITGELKDIYVKASDTLPIGTVVEYDGDVIPDGYAKVDDSNTYSTKEQVIGTWTDGRPLYRKTVFYEAETSSQNLGVEIGVSHDISDVDFIMVRKDKTYLLRLNTYKLYEDVSIIVTEPSDYKHYLNTFRSDKDKVYFYTGDYNWVSGENLKLHCTVEYTKTTD